MGPLFPVFLVGRYLVSFHPVCRGIVDILFMAYLSTGPNSVSFIYLLENNGAKPPVWTRRTVTSALPWFLAVGRWAPWACTVIHVTVTGAPLFQAPALLQRLSSPPPLASLLLPPPLTHTWDSYL